MLSPSLSPSGASSRGGYRALLKRELGQRRERRSAYSQGAFARDLGLLASRLSEILRGRQGLSSSTARQVARRMGWSVSEQRYFCEMVRAEDGRSALERNEAKRRLEELKAEIRYEELREDASRLLADWYHLPVIELLKTRGAQATPEWIARRLSISEAQAADALDRLVRLRFVEVKEGKPQVARPHNHVARHVPKERVRQFHGALLDRAKTALETQSPDAREFNTVVLTLSKEALPSFKARIGEFVRALDRDARAEAKASDVYCLGVQLFSLTEGEST
jgi:uncharacterized protein (TIGR02147 family)